MSTIATTVPIGAIAPPADGVNPRQDEPAGDHFEELVESIKRHGILQPILVQPTEAPGGVDAYTLIAGSRRLAAARQAGLEEIPIHTAAGASNGDAAVAALVENVHRADLTPLEEAEAVAALRDALPESKRKKPTATLSKTLGKSSDWVQKRLQLLALPATAKDAVRAGHVGLHGAPVLARVAKASPQLAEELVAMVVPGDNDGNTPAHIGHAISDHYAARLAKAKTAPEVFGIFLQAIVATELADDTVVAQSNRLYVHLDYALKPMVLPKAIKARMADQRKEEREAEHKDQRAVEIRILHELNAAGTDITTKALGETRISTGLPWRVATSWLSPPMIGPAVKRLAKAGEVTTQGAGENTVVTITDTGRQNLQEAIANA